MQTVRKNEFEAIANRHLANQGTAVTSATTATAGSRGAAGQKARAMLRARLGEEVYTAGSTLWSSIPSLTAPYRFRFR